MADYKRICSVDGCGKKHKGRGYCQSHLVRSRRYGDPEGSYQKRGRVYIYRECSIAGCISDAGCHGAARGFCRAHYKRLLRHGTPTGGGTPMGARSEWIEKNKNHLGDDCLPWPFGIGRAGYGQYKVNGKSTPASRAMCIAAHGDPPTPQHQAAHKCGKGHLGCTNPMHLYWATRLENESDKLLHGTTVRGERQGSSKLTEADVLNIRKSGNLNRVIADQYGISRQYVSKIKSRKTWAWLE